MRLRSPPVVYLLGFLLGLVLAKAALADKAGAKKAVFRQAKLIGGAPEHLQVRGHEALRWSTPEHAPGTTRVAHILDNGDALWRTKAGKQSWQSWLQNGEEYRSHSFAMGKRNVKLARLGFRPGESITLKTSLTNGRVQNTAATIRFAKGTGEVYVFVKRLP